MAEAISKSLGRHTQRWQKERPVALELLSQIEHGVPYYMIIPMILVIVLSFMGLNTPDLFGLRYDFRHAPGIDRRDDHLPGVAEQSGPGWLPGCRRLCGDYDAVGVCLWRDYE